MSVTGYSGGEVNITCKYDKGYTENKKYFLKEQGSMRRDRIRTNEKDKWVKNDRFSLYDDTSSAVFTVTLGNLRERDSGTYQCGVDIKSGTDPLTVVNLKVITDTSERRSRKPTTTASDHMTKPATEDSESIRPVTSSTSSPPPSSSTLPPSSYSSSPKLQLDTSESESRKPTTTASDHMTKPATEDSESIRPVTSSNSSPPPSSSTLPPSSYSSSPKLQLDTSERRSRKPTTTASDHMTKPATEDSESIRPVTSLTSSPPPSSSTFPHSLYSSSPKLQLDTSESESRKPTTTASDHMTKPATEDSESIRPVTSSTSSPPPSSSTLPPSSYSSSPKLQLG
ncbi:hypothetical protein PO909_016308, partial [Leuciscus waleckii]